jgi:hypothetical protein
VAIQQLSLADMEARLADSEEARGGAEELVLSTAKEVCAGAAVLRRLYCGAAVLTVWVFEIGALVLFMLCIACLVCSCSKASFIHFTG